MNFLRDPISLVRNVYTQARSLRSRRLWRTLHRQLIVLELEKQLVGSLGRRWHIEVARAQEVEDGPELCAIAVDEGIPFIVYWDFVPTRKHCTEHGIRAPGESAQRRLKFGSANVQFHTLLELGAVLLDDRLRAMPFHALGLQSLLLRALIHRALQCTKVERVGHVVELAAHGGTPVQAV